MIKSSIALILSLFGLLLLPATLGAQGADAKAKAIIERARATVGTEDALDGLVTLRLVGTLDPADSRLPSATILIIARKPCSQRMEIRIDDMVETTILKGRKACIVRSNLNEEASQMRHLAGPELDRVRYSTRQFFGYFRPDHRRGEQVTFEGIEPRHDQRCYKLRYQYPDGIETIRYFSLEDDRLVSTITENGVESVGLGTQAVGGIKFPKQIVYYEDSRQLHTITFRKVEVNQPLPAGIFDLPRSQSE
ncbi:MAG: hypothetical protein EA353_07945 [Puniceicoccaceae bacterium]|nr:MAG: hypothetical protein EA353_07945 [Puniceicoccaceae bacterium]